MTMLAVAAHTNDIKLEFENMSNDRTKEICMKSIHILVWTLRDPNKKIAKTHNSVQFICSELAPLRNFKDPKLRLTYDLRNHSERIIDKINLVTILSQYAFAPC